ncbi:WD40 repeat-like protein [Canariomyces notabilis]|uniref:WD40 repeat-like protein n=1 Tax=Canariomyces notabilis TaxID=2074819 RepID=A0AAN6TB57_9PEZI|nr:WD40 repeat-like protein [Canariomyces arenarius]
MSVTLPIRSSRPRPRLASSFYSGNGSRFQRPDLTAEFTRLRIGSLRRPDRFIPARPREAELTERFRTGKAAHELTAFEKLLRNNMATEDPFRYRRRAVLPMSAQLRLQSRSEATGSRNRVGSVLGALDQNSIDNIDNQPSDGTIWTVGVAPHAGTAVNDGRGQLVSSGTNARLFRSTFPTAKRKAEEELEKHGARLAAALRLDRSQRVLEVNVTPYRDGINKKMHDIVSTQWNGTEWVNEGTAPTPSKSSGNRILPLAPFKVLDAPNLRDDFYCSVLAYSPTCQTLAVGLGDFVYGWSESRGVQLLNAGRDSDSHLTSLSFSSSEGCKAILAFGRTDRTLTLMSLYDDPDPEGSSPGPLPRFKAIQPCPVTCLSWKPVCTLRPSKSRFHPDTLVKNEDLLVGDEAGHVYYYAVEWPERWEVARHNWSGQMTLMARIAIHTQHICGLAWSRNGELFCTGGNDNLCCLFETDKLGESSLNNQSSNGELQGERSRPTQPRVRSEGSEAGTQIRTLQNTVYPARFHGPGSEKHRWVHGAAVKAIAFCPWQESLVATGGGSNDKCIHFFHATSGAALATISVSAQVTSLIWSTTRREIVATFGYAQPEHPIRIAVFSWPDCCQVAAIPWAGEHRALYAIAYPNGPGERSPSEKGNRARNRGRPAMGGCIMVASSDKSVKFHEVWAADKKATGGGVGILGGSDILECLEGIDKDGGVIR